MLSLPMIAPQPEASLWPSHLVHHGSADTEASQSAPSAPQAQRRLTSQHGSRHLSASLLALNEDENTIEQRKQNVRRFGASWIRPPGVAKTLQAMKDEELEREEQEMMRRREQAMDDLHAAQEEAANHHARHQLDHMAHMVRQEDEDDEDDDGERERDLDDDVPEAEASDSDLVPSGSDTGSEIEHGQDTTVPFNEDSFIEGSMLEAEVSHMLEREEAEMAGVLQEERDLDDDIPEAGSYEHTDSELEDSSHIDHSGLLHLNSAPSNSSARRRRGRPTSALRNSDLSSRTGSRPSRINLGADRGQGRSSFGMEGSSSLFDGSSFLRSSPVTAAAAARGNLRDRLLGATSGGPRA